MISKMLKISSNLKNAHCRYIFILTLQCVFSSVSVVMGTVADPSSSPSSSDSDSVEELDFYSYFAVDAFDNIIAFEKFRGKVSLVMNVASECGYTEGHYDGINLLQKFFEETGKFNVMAFPCNQFGAQEPGTIEEIRSFVFEEMGLQLELFAKVDVLGDKALPAWKYLIEKTGKKPTWNFWKYLINHKGEVIGAWPPSKGPDQIYQYIKEAIDAIGRDGTSGRDRENRRVKEEF